MITTKWEEITPKKAAAYLKRNVTNRPLREATVKGYEADMRSGNWVPTHQGVAFNDREELIDGQHRLTAVVHSEVTVRMLVTRGLPAKTGETHTMDAVDRGAVRSIADQLRLQHGFSNPNLGIAVVALIANIVLTRRVKKQTTSQVLLGLDLYGRHIGEIGALVDNPREKRFRRAAFVAALTFARAIEPGAIDRFLKGMLTGAGLEATSPVLSLRNFLLSDAATLQFSLSLEDRVRLTQVVLNSLHAFVENRPLGRVIEGRAGFIFFAGRQTATIEKLATAYLGEPASMKPDPAGRARVIRDSQPRAAVAGVTGRVIRSAADIDWHPTPEVDDMLRGRDLSDRATRKAASR